MLLQTSTVRSSQWSLKKTEFDARVGLAYNTNPGDSGY